MTHKPTVSVVICTLNGAATIERAIESIRAQTYPAEQFELLVVNDGSTDDTANILRRIDVRTVTLPENQGIAAARNAGLAAAKGKIYVGFDDDCIAEPTWLEQLMSGYDGAGDEVLGVGGVIAAPTHMRGLADHYMAATGSGNPPSIKLNPSQSIVRRFIAYYADQIMPNTDMSQAIIPVRHINGASASFPVEKLRQVGGWDPTMSGVEDTDICHRLALLNPQGRFLAVPGAVLTHDPKLSVSALIRRQLSRAATNLKYYRRNGLVPPIFPFPLAWIVLSLVAAIGHPILGLVSLVISPLVLYSWWPIRAITERRPLYPMLAYIQLAEESAAVIGLVRAMIVARNSRS